MIHLICLAAVLPVPPQPTPGPVAGRPATSAEAHAPTQVELTAIELFALADAARNNGDVGTAERVYRALAQDPNPEIRAEARFRLGMVLTDAGRLQDAALAFRALLDEKPDAARVRIELARVLTLIGDEGGARRELRQAQAAGLPSDVALVVDQFANVLRARKPFGSSLSVALVPDSNINRATDRETLDTIIAPLELSEDAREQLGVGLRVGGQGYLRLPLAANLALLPRVSGQTELYRRSQFNDVSASVAVGLEWAAGESDQVRPTISQTVRFYGGDFYAQTQSALVNWTHRLGRTSQLDTRLTVARADYQLNDLQDGWLFDLSASYERALSARSGGGLTLNFSRQTARDPGYSTTSGGVSLLHYRELGRMTAFGSLGLRRLEGDARLFLFTDRRREWLLSSSLGATFRQATVAGFAPLMRLSYERNWSTVGIYDYARTALELGVTRAF